MSILIDKANPQKHTNCSLFLPHTFTGKEKDEETGYGYFGARYMDYELMTMWLSVDPMADKYPSISPYAYCAWNPVKLVDPDGRDWYEYTDKETGKKEIRWTDYHSQKQMDENDVDGRYLGVTVEDGDKYYSLFGTTENLKTPAGYLVQALDREIIKYVRCNRMGEDPNKIEYGDFSNIYNFDRQTILGMNMGGINVHNESDLQYAGADNVHVMVNDVDMNGRLESLTPTTKPLAGPNGGDNRVVGFRFNVNRKDGYSLVTFSYGTKAKANAFTDRVQAMMKKGVYPTLKQMKHVNGRFHQITRYD